MSRTKTPLTGAYGNYMVCPLRSCSTPYTNPDDLETSGRRPNQPRFDENVTIGSILI